MDYSLYDAINHSQKIFDIKIEISMIRLQQIFTGTSPLNTKLCQMKLYYDINSVKMYLNVFYSNTLYMCSVLFFDFYHNDVIHICLLFGKNIENSTVQQ